MDGARLFALIYIAGSIENLGVLVVHAQVDTS